MRRLARGLVLALVLPLSSASGNGLPGLAGPPAELLMIDRSSVTTHWHGTAIRDAIRTPDGRIIALADDAGLKILDGGGAEVTPPAGADVPVTSIARVGETLWIAGESFGVRRLEGDRFVEVALPRTAEGRPLVVHDLVAFRDQVWVSTSRGLFRETDEHGLAAVARTEDTPRGRVSAFHVQGDEHLLCGTNLSELCVFDGTTWTRQDFKGRLDGGVIRALHEDPKWIWIGTFGALYMWSPTLDELHDETELRPDIFRARIVTSLAGDDRDVLVGTAGGGVLRFAIAQQVFRIHDPSNGLAGTLVNRVRLSGDLALVSTSNGLSLVDRTVPLPGAPAPSAPTASPPPSPPTASPPSSPPTASPPSSPPPPRATGSAEPAGGARAARPIPDPAVEMSPDTPGLDPMQSTGRFLFTDPQILGPRARSLEMSCETCHPGGGAAHDLDLPGSPTDAGLVDITDRWLAPRAENGVRDPRVIPHLGGLARRAPYGAQGRHTSLRGYVRHHIVIGLGGPEPNPLTLDALEAYLATFPLPRPRSLDEHGRPTREAGEAVRRGALAFEMPLDPAGSFTCATCHVPATGFTDGRIHDVGTGGPLKTPTLLGRGGRSRYLGDGSAPSLGAALDRHADHFGGPLPPERRSALLAFLDALGL